MKGWAAGSLMGAFAAPKSVCHRARECENGAANAKMARPRTNLNGIYENLAMGEALTWLRKMFSSVLS